MHHHRTVYGGCSTLRSRIPSQLVVVASVQLRHRLQIDPDIIEVMVDLFCGILQPVIWTTDAHSKA
jgi:hypothetical protein